jgi:hypothetical protein
MAMFQTTLGGWLTIMINNALIESPSNQTWFQLNPKDKGSH